MLRTAVLLTLCMVLTASPAFAQGLGENPLVTIYPVVALAALVVFIAVPKRWALWCGIVVWGIGLLVNLPTFPVYLIVSAFVLPLAFVLRWLVKRGKPSREE